jgi:hypothetical protein
MRHRLIPLAMAVFVLAMKPLAAMAAPAIDPSKSYDGRLDGYTPLTLTVDNGGSAVMWLLLIGISVIGLGVMFKHAKRTHLD